MIEKRKSHREHLLTRTILSQQDSILHGQLENISMSGALVRLEFGTYLPKGGEYDLTVYLEGEAFPLQFNVEVVSVAFALAGIKFVSYFDDTETRLSALLRQLSSQPDRATIELERIQRG
jgi:hypothetical protein